MKVGSTIGWNSEPRQVRKEAAVRSLHLDGGKPDWSPPRWIPLVEKDGNRCVLGQIKRNFSGTISFPLAFLHV